MRRLTDCATPGHTAQTLLILLPGAYQQPEDFVREGFVAAVRQRQLAVDVSMIELQFEHVASDQALPQIHASLIQPAQTAGYRQIWLAGISIGGYVAMAYADRYPGQVAGLLLLAPYPGNRMTTNEIIAAGGVHSWLPESIAAEDTERRNWQWLKTHARGAMPVHLAYGEDDRFADSHAMMAQVLPPAQVDHVPGDHVWPVWRQLWERFLDGRFNHE